jgi:hypothetical protein
MRSTIEGYLIAGFKSKYNTILNKNKQKYKLLNTIYILAKQFNHKRTNNKYYKKSKIQPKQTNKQTTTTTTN